jgi:DNA-binding transcriptional LysR family regulator
VAAPIAFGAHSLAPTIVKFMKRYPQVTVELMLNDRKVDPVEEGIDIALRVGTLADSAMMSRSLSPYRTVVCASPEYLAERGRPAHPKDLVGNDCLSFPDWTEGPRWSFSGPEGEVHVDVKSRLQINNGFESRYAALAGAGIAMQRAELVAEDIAVGRLQPLLADYKAQLRSCS